MAGSGDLEVANRSLQELWAGACDAWVAPPGTKEVVYLCPVDQLNAPQATEPWPAWIDTTLRLADSPGLFALTAYNPLGQELPQSVNCEQNAQLQKEIEELNEGGASWWHSFGFAADWHEKGFCVAADLDLVVALARKYRQGAIYRFQRVPADGGSEGPAAAFTRSTVPVCLEDTEADVLIAPCARPPYETASPDWTAVEASA
eukprot:gnl/TRDRNA2_/TRDRNA2_194572_c0_seq1.p1 gnl/TRDRNA2_/TRDRNA2_194572_c0~~gnl/TRDRNA2_/TRDRNA2_194572_c0_seq1.p1  ORF type:complete len:203 (+),score=42.45 gnl/TRDRNA2_/TRDRNA2_194572_c0_seq1:70-678(+)